MRQLLAISLFILSGFAVAETQTITSLTTEDEERLNAHRAVVEQFLSPSDLKAKYITAAGKLGALRALIAAKRFKANQTYELQSMGIVFGDAFVENMGFHWVMVSDEYGRDPAIKYKDTSVILFPLTILSKRIEQGEQVDVFDLYNGIASKVEEILRKGA